MTTEQRIQRCRLIEKMAKQEEYSKKLGLENKSQHRSKMKGGKNNE